MKKLFSIALVSLMLVGCANSNTATTTAEKTAEPQATETKETKLGIGSVTSLKFADASADKEGSVQASTTIVALATVDGVISYIDIDVAQNSGKFDTAGVITSDKEAATLTKAEKGADYGMKAASSIGKEWFEQADAFEEYAIGKTVAEVLATPVYEKDENHKAVPESDDLKTSVTIDIGSFLKAIEKADANSVVVESVANVQTASVTSVKFKDAAADADGQIQFNTYYTLTATDADGKFVFTSLDTAQNAGKFDAKGVITSDKEAATLTKTEKGADYGMKAASSIGKEWFEQADAFEEYAIGKTVAEVLATPVYEKDENHKAVPESDDLKTSVTIDIGSFLKVIEAASKNTNTLK